MPFLCHLGARRRSYCIRNQTEAWYVMGCTGFARTGNIQMRSQSLLTFHVGRPWRLVLQEPVATGAWGSTAGREEVENTMNWRWLVCLWRTLPDRKAVVVSFPWTDLQERKEINKYKLLLWFKPAPVMVASPCGNQLLILCICPVPKRSLKYYLNLEQLIN